MRREDDLRWLSAAIELAGRCPPASAAYSVGAIVLSAAGAVVSCGYSRESDPHDHAEEAAIGKAAAIGADLTGATLYSSLEPCLRRVSRPVPCARLIARARIGRVVIAWREPPLFQPGGGAAWLAGRGIDVVELGELARAAQAPNSALLRRHAPGAPG